MVGDKSEALFCLFSAHENISHSVDSRNVIYYAAFLRVLSVRLPVRARNSKTKKRRKIKIGIDVPHCTSKWSANFFSSKGQSSRSQDIKTSKIWCHAYLLAAAPADQARQAPSENKAYAIVRPNSLSVPETLGCSATGGTDECAAAAASRVFYVRYLLEQARNQGGSERADDPPVCRQKVRFRR